MDSLTGYLCHPRLDPGEFMIAESMGMNKSIKKVMRHLTSEIFGKSSETPRSLFHCSYMRYHNGKDWKSIEVKIKLDEYMAKEISEWMKNM